MCGFDGNQSAIEAVQDGPLALDIAQNGYDMGYKAVEAAFAALDDETVESFVDSGSTVVESSRVEAYISDMQAKELWEEKLFRSTITMKGEGRRTSTATFLLKAEGDTNE